MPNNLENSIKEVQEVQKSINDLFADFDNPVKIEQKILSKNTKTNLIRDEINTSVENVLEELVSKTINANPSLMDSKNVQDVMKSFENFLVNSDLGAFEYVQKTGKNILKVEHSMGVNGSNFCKKFFERLFKICLNDYSFHVIFDDHSVCVIFR